MRFGGIVLGIIILFLGAIFFYSPLPSATAQERGDEQIAYQTQTILPRWIALGAMILGAIIVAASMLLPPNHTHVPNAPYDPERARYHTEKDQDLRSKAQ